MGKVQEDVVSTTSYGKCSGVGLRGSGGKKTENDTGLCKSKLVAPVKMEGSVPVEGFRLNDDPRREGIKRVCGGSNEAMSDHAGGGGGKGT